MDKNKKKFGQHIYELVKQRKLDVVGNYVYLIISENASEVEQLIKK